MKKNNIKEERKNIRRTKYPENGTHRHTHTQIHQGTQGKRYHHYTEYLTLVGVKHLKEAL